MNPNNRFKKLKHFWIDPLIIGMLLMFGYSITKRIFIKAQYNQMPSETFLEYKRQLPGKKLSELSGEPISFEEKPENNKPIEVNQMSPNERSNIQLSNKKAENETNNLMNNNVYKRKNSSQLKPERRGSLIQLSEEAKEFFKEKNADNLIKTLPKSSPRN